MLPQRATMMMLLFVSPENPIWQILLETADKRIETKIADYLGISRQTINNWKNGGVVGSYKGKPLDDHVFKTVSERIEGGARDQDVGRVRLDDQQKAMIKEIVSNFDSIYRRSAQHKVYDAAKALNIPIQKCQEIIDDAIYSRFPVFPEMYYTDDARSQEDLKRDFNRYKGVYNLNVRRPHNGEETWLRCPLRVRYTIKIGEGVAIRCKLNLPILEPQSEKLPYWQYDGFLTVRDRALFWNFERRRSAGNLIDYFSFITSSGRNWPNDKGALTATGTYLTIGQDRRRSIVTNDLVLQKQHLDLEKEDEVVAFMHCTAKRLDNKKDHQRLDRLLKNFRTSIE